MSTAIHAAHATATVDHQRRLAERLMDLASDIVVSASPRAQAILEQRSSGCRLLTVTSSHLGHSSELHASVCRYLSRSMIQARQCGQAALVCPGSAIHPWAKRAAELFGIQVIEIQLVQHDDLTSDAISRRASRAERDHSATLLVASSSPLCRDRVMIQLADQVDCVFARPAGKVASAVSSRLNSPHRGTVRIAIHDRSIHEKSAAAAHKLMESGALGWYCQRLSYCNPNVQQSSATPSNGPMSDDGWTRSDGQWLVHCTRGHQGPWPGQTERQYRDELLLHPQPSAATSDSSPMRTLKRILRMKRLVASSIATDNHWPVVCLSEQPLATLLAGRNYRSHLHRWDYEPYGIAIRKSAAMQAGCQPVLYGEASRRGTVAAQDQFRFQSSGKTYDWTQEREWRFPKDVLLDQFAREDIRVFVPSEQERRGLNTCFEVTTVSLDGDSIKPAGAR